MKAIAALSATLVLGIIVAGTSVASSDAGPGMIRDSQQASAEYQTVNSDTDPGNSSSMTSHWQRTAQACNRENGCDQFKCCAGLKCVKSKFEGKPWYSCEPDSRSCEAKLEKCQNACGDGDPVDASGKPPASWKRCFARCGERYPNC